MRKGKPAPKRKAPAKAPAKMKRTAVQARNQRAAIGAMMQPGGPLNGGA